MHVKLDVRKCFDCDKHACVQFTTTGDDRPVVLMCEILHSQIIVDRMWERWPWGSNSVIVKKVE